MRRADDPDTVVMPEMRSRTSSDSSESDIDGAATLQAMLPSIKAVSEFGEVEGWHPQRQDHESYCQRAREMQQDGTLLRMEVTPLMIRKTRDSAALFSSPHIAAIA